jgi:hypothetical protein
MIPGAAWAKSTSGLPAVREVHAPGSSRARRSRGAWKTRFVSWTPHLPFTRGRREGTFLRNPTLTRPVPQEVKAAAGDL